ncbi:hypothetical protein [Elioraea rosea]|uniref:hypothetical protein n=1 Tax=Elioraea rosea TaxID=2492390 RepID=UPI001182BE75|nr:hypothetical protein [Elioraea rosea]
MSRSLADDFYLLNLLAFDVRPDGWDGDRLHRDELPALRRILSAIVERDHRGESTTYAPHVGSRHGTLRSIELGPDLPGTRCIPLRTEHESRDASFLLVHDVGLFRNEFRYCLAGGGRTVVLGMMERWLESDPRAEERAASAHAIGKAFFRSLRPE